jgi:hypothetical protein
MARPTFRKEMAMAWAFPALLFVVLPSSVVLFAAPSFLTGLWGLLLAIGTLLAPAFLVGLALAPWAGRQVGRTKAPAFAMAAVAASTSAAAAGAVAHSIAAAAFVALFALPASLFGALFFIGACERTRPLEASNGASDWVERAAT